jgi:predicted nucleotidyltransferase
MIAEADIRLVGRQIGEAARAERVVLFGSHANGRATADSDVDFLVVAESDLPRHKRSRELYRRIRPHRFAIDIVVYTPAEVRRGCETPVSFVSQALREGKTVYAR